MSLIRTNRACGGKSLLDWRGALAGVALLAFVAVSPGQVSVSTVGGGVHAQCGNSYGFVAGDTWTTAQFHLPIATALDSQGNLWVADMDNNDIEEVTLAGNRTSSLTYEYASGSNKHPFTNVISIAVDAADNLYVLTTNKLFVYTDATASFPPNLNILFATATAWSNATAMTVANDANTNIYVSFTNKSSKGTIIRISQPWTGSYSTVVSNYSFAPSGLSIRSDGRLAVSDTLSNAIYIIDTTNGSTPILVTGGIGAGYVNGAPGVAKFNQPHGIAASGDGRMVVCDTSNNYVRVIDTSSNTTTLYGTPTNVWVSTACSASPPLYLGWVDGVAGSSSTNASSRTPVSVTIAPNGTLFVTESYYNLIRAVTNSGLAPVTSINSGGSTNPPVVTTLAASAISGTGATLNASVNPNGASTTVYFEWGTNTSYGNNTSSTTLTTNLDTTNAVALPLTGLQPNTVIHFQAVAFNSGGTTDGGDRQFETGVATTAAFSIGPSYGYFPECQTIMVTNPTATIVYYTEDGTTPTINSPQVSLTTTNSAGLFTNSFQWCNPQADLSTLLMGTASGGVVNTVLLATSSPTNQLGFVRNPSAGIGSVAYVPIVLDLQSGVSIESLQFRIEVTPTTNGGVAPPMVSSLSLLPITPNDFVQMIGPAPANAPVSFSIVPYTNTLSSNGQGLVVYTEGPGTGLDIQNFGVVGLLQIPIPYSASTGQTYSLNILYPSGTAAGGQIGVPVGAMPAQTLTVADLLYLAGDSAPAYGYNAEEFGDGILDNRDVNNAIYASMLVRVPPLYSDAFNAMDVAPQTTALNGDGDGSIDFQDWNQILLRSLGLDTPNWVRSWTNGGFLIGAPINEPAGLPGDPAVPTDTATPQGSPPGLVWLCQASIGAGTVTNLVPGNTCTLPVYATVRPGCSLSGFQFRAIVSPNGNAPPVGQVTFATAPGIPNPMFSSLGLSTNDILRAWELGAFTTPLQNSNAIGTISFQVPPTAQAGQSYAVHFLGVSGAPDGTTAYTMESFPGYAWVLSTALQPASITSDEWKKRFFGSLSNSLAGDNVDADGDGASNWQEYLAGTDPTNPLSAFKFGSANFSTNVALSWLTAPGKTYILQSTPSFGGKSWTAINTNTGDGYTYQFIQTKYNGNAQFYRILLQP